MSRFEVFWAGFGSLQYWYIQVLFTRLLGIDCLLGLCSMTSGCLRLIPLLMDDGYAPAKAITSDETQLDI
jgi:hypothetical protein